MAQADRPTGPDAGLRRRRREAVAGLLVLAVLIALPLVAGSVYWRNILILTLLYAGLSQAWNILGGYCGQISLGHALYFGTGAYLSTELFVRLGVPPVLGMWAAGAVAASVALLVGWSSFRLSGHYYAIATLVIGEIFFLLFLNWDWVGGALGITIPLGPDSWITLQFRTSKLPYYYMMLAYAAAVWLLTFWLAGSKTGFAWRAIKDEVAGAESLGVRIYPAKLKAAAASAFATGIGGALYAQYVGYIDPDSVFTSQLSVLIALPAVLGGVGSLWGPSLGAAVLIPVTELTRNYLGGSGSGVDLMFYGALIMLVATLKPEGLTGLLHLDGTRRRRAAADAEKLRHAA